MLESRNVSIQNFIDELLNIPIPEDIYEFMEAQAPFEEEDPVMPDPPLQPNQFIEEEFLQEPLDAQF